LITLPTLKGDGGLEPSPGHAMKLPSQYRPCCQAGVSHGRRVRSRLGIPPTCSVPARPTSQSFHDDPSHRWRSKGVGDWPQTRTADRWQGHGPESSAHLSPTSRPKSKRDQGSASDPRTGTAPHGSRRRSIDSIMSFVCNSGATVELTQKTSCGPVHSAKILPTTA
jgi:hypothetical protein